MQQESTQGRFVRVRWYERGIEHGNPHFNDRFRVNAPGASMSPEFMYRDEVRDNGMMQIRVDEDLAQLDGAELYCELWGGHPGTAGKRVSINGRSTYVFPEIGSADGHCTHQYPTIPLELTDLVNGYNAIQFACDQGTGFWGHYIVDNACLRTILRQDHPVLQSLGLGRFVAKVETSSLPLVLGLACPLALTPVIASVDFYGRYDGYDENGNAHTQDWHGFTKQRRSVAHLGTVTVPPFTMTWDTSMIPAQGNVAVRAVVHFKPAPDIVYETPVTEGLAITHNDAQVILSTAVAPPVPFWSRAGREMRCSLPLAIDPRLIDRAVLHIVVWDGGCGSVATPITLNDTPLSVLGQGAHDVLYRQVDLPNQVLRWGNNTLCLLSDTEHHGIEVLRPGPALMVRTSGG